MRCVIPIVRIVSFMAGLLSSFPFRVVAGGIILQFVAIAIPGTKGRSCGGFGHDSHCNTLATVLL